ncbi:MAG: hypothetical protein B9S38_00705 [Verrucomicrobiia bacterium Tous-C4TDCM]|jgi:hypothetical protein|nr:MAG: hypothetical protein B9S38_00705 [Verrucomicrobiae bacterium Tous-C4TDCM]
MHHSSLPTLDRVKRVNRSWLVQGHLNDHADAWLEYLASHGDPRLQSACMAARRMCALRGPLEDSKPWFHAGLFSPATAPEARRFIASHRVTKATVPAMADDDDVKLWLDQPPFPRPPVRLGQA